ncbi:TPA: hypothetical protein SMT91_000593 [Proteus mirabilis]|nr:hypothetical protein [Proteus mirabilis]
MDRNHVISVYTWDSFHVWANLPMVGVNALRSLKPSEKVDALSASPF